MSANAKLTVSLILTVKNEEATLPAFFDSLDAQTLPPSEVILVDGGSTDATLEIIRRWKTTLPFIMVSEPGAGISRGRNIALQRSTGTIVAVTDAGTRLRPDWIERLVEPFERDPKLQPDVVAGFFDAETSSDFELALAVTTLPDVDEIRPDRFLPSSRSVAFRRSLFESGIRYPEWLDYCEDLVFDLKLKRMGARFEFCPGARVWFRPRETIREHWLQYFRYARGDGEAGLFTRRHAIRYATYVGFLPWALKRRDAFGVAATVVGITIYLRRPVIRLLRRRTVLPARTFAKSLLYIPALRLVGDSAKMAGYPLGVWWRARRFGLRHGWMSIRMDESCSGTDLLKQGGSEEFGGPHTGSSAHF